MKVAKDASLMAMAFVGMIVIMGTTVALRSTILAPIQLIEVEVTVLDQDTRLPVPNAVVMFDYVNWPFHQRGDVDFSVITGEDGRATRQITGQAGVYYITVMHSDYLTEEFGSYRFTEKYVQLELEVERNPDPPGGYDATFYVVDQGGHRIEYVEAVYEGESIRGTPDGRVIVNGIESGWHSIRFKSLRGVKSFDFTRDFEMPSHDQTYTVNVDTKTIMSGDPPEPPDPWSQIRLWVALTVIILVLSVSFALLFQGRGPELIKMAKGRK